MGTTENVTRALQASINVAAMATVESDAPTMTSTNASDRRRQLKQIRIVGAGVFAVVGLALVAVIGLGGPPAVAQAGCVGACGN